MSLGELQQEELEVLNSIYEGDDCYKQVAATKFQYKVQCVGSNEEGDATGGGERSFLLEVEWPPGYPEELPVINMDLFYNKHVPNTVREHIMDGLKEQCTELLGMAMTYTLFEWCKENGSELTRGMTDSVANGLDAATAAHLTISDDTKSAMSAAAAAAPAVVSGKTKKGGSNASGAGPPLSKAQKRRLADRGGLSAGGLPRGHDWVDIIRHLSQTGGSKSG